MATYALTRLREKVKTEQEARGFLSRAYHSFRPSTSERILKNSERIGSDMENGVLYTELRDANTPKDFLYQALRENDFFPSYRLDLKRMDERKKIDYKQLSHDLLVPKPDWADVILEDII